MSRPRRTLTMETLNLSTGDAHNWIDLTPGAPGISFVSTDRWTCVVPKTYLIDWTKVQSLSELLAAMNHLEVSVSDQSRAYPLVKHLLKDE